MDARSLRDKGFIIMDNHMHLREDGRYMGAVDLFISSGGNCINLVNVPRYDFGVKNYYDKLYRNTIGIANRIREERSIPVLVTLGPYPLDYFRFQKEGLDPVAEMKHGIDLVVKLASSGACNALGEVGRPHFSVPDQVFEDSNEVISYGMSQCKELDIPIILHTEDLSDDSYLEMERLARKNGLNAEKVIKHHALPIDLRKRNAIQKSILASRSSIREAAGISPEFFMETDYVDDPNSWKVIPPDSVPKRVTMIAQEFNNWDEILQECCMNLPLRVYGSDAFRTKGRIH